jgi:diaminopropionate ammonia-lyase
VIFMPKGTSAFREQAIAAFGATTIRVAGDYDAAHAFAEAQAARHGWLLAADSPAGPQPDAARQIVQGYSVLGQELLDQTAGMPATHLLVGTGSGSLAAGIAARFAAEPPDRPRPRLILVQPATADSALESFVHRERRPAPGSLVTVMDGLSVRWLSAPAWTILSRRAFAGVAVDDSAALAALRTLDQPEGGDPPMIAGDTGVAATAALLASAEDATARIALQIDASSRVMAVVTEGATDPELRARLLARAGEASPRGGPTATGDRD